MFTDSIKSLRFCLSMGPVGWLVGLMIILMLVVIGLMTLVYGPWALLQAIASKLNTLDGPKWLKVFTAAYAGLIIGLIL